MNEERPDDIVGHKTFRDGDGFRHEPLTRAEAERFREAADKAKATRAEKYPTAEDAVRGLWDAWYRLKEMGWQDPRYAPGDRRTKRTICLGCSAILDARCEPRTDGNEGTWWWHNSDDGDTYPHSPIFYLPDEIEAEERRVRMEKIRERRERLVADTDLTK